ncbi:hypothetical protein C8J56DRAFT_912353 [Mycena floridula]|nr:hypothetical protein C8J56DRAFT_912353 [Mycena floridula]
MPVNVPELLASSSIPTEAERAHLNQLLDASNAEISRLTAAIHKLVQEREALEQNVASYKIILAPIRRLPEDMLREIFVHCLPANKAAATVITDAPLLLGRICHSWRELALSTPALWASIHVQFPYDVDLARAQRLCDEAQTWLARSGTCPLTIKVLEIGDNQPPGIDFIKFLTTKSTQWRSVEISATEGSMVPLLSLTKSDVPRLEKFIHTATRGTPIDARTQEENFWSALRILEGKRLCEVGFLGSRLRNIAAMTSKMELGQLTRLDLHAARPSSLTLKDTIDILSRCHSLTACSISIASCLPAMGAWNFEPMTLLHLSSFSLILRIDLGFSTLTSLDVVMLEKFFSNVNFPQLTSFSHNIGAYSAVSWVALARRCPIENLALIDFSHESVLQYLRADTNIKRLKITSPSLWFDIDPAGPPKTEREILVLLMATDKHAALCPFLEVLELENLGFPDITFTDSDFVNLVQQRAAMSSGGNQPLKVVRASFTHDVDIKVIAQLEDLITSGLSVSISYERHAVVESTMCYWPCKPAELKWPM